MAFDLKSIRPTKRSTPPRVLIHGAHKVGKSTWAAAAPGAIFVPTEDGQDAINASAFPLCQTWGDVLAAVGSLVADSHDYKTVVLDSVDWAEQLAHREVCRAQNVKSIEGCGYGKGYVYAADLFRDLLDGLNALRLEKGMMVVLIAHSEIRKFDDPLADSYDRYQVKTHKLVAKLVQEWCDVVAFAQIDSITKTEKGAGFREDRARVLDTGRRVLRLQNSAAYDAGNRYGLPATLDLNYAAFAAELEKCRG